MAEGISCQFRCIRLSEAISEEWDLLAWSKGTVFHTRAFRRILVDTFGYQCHYHAIYDQNDKICALIPLVGGRNLGLKMAGISLPFVNYVDICATSEEAFQYALTSLGKLKNSCKLDYLELRLKDQEAGTGSWKQKLSNVTFTLPLFDSEAEVLALSTASNRNHIRKVYKNERFTSSFDPSYLDDFYQVYVRRMKQLGSPAPAIEFFRSFFDYLPNHTFLLTVHSRESQSVVGGMLLLLSPANKTVYYPYGANLIQYNHQYLNNFMYWEAVKFGIRQGMKHLDLGRSPIGSGTFTYKSQWGAKAEPLKYLAYDDGSGGSSQPDKNDLQIFVELWKKMPAWITDRAGKYLIKYVMP